MKQSLQSIAAIASVVCITGCSESVQSFSECITHPDANITNRYCEVGEVRFISPTSISSQSASQISSSNSSSTQSADSSAADQSSEQTSAQSSTADALPASVRLQVPFTPQAPTANWNPPFDEACEEVSYLMVEYMMQGKTFTPQSAEAAIAEFVQWQQEQGLGVDITISQLAQAVEQKYGRNPEVFTGNEVTVQKIEQLLNDGYPVIIPAAGQLLGNPYFSGDGPPYHMLVITGYDANNFITNDPGTKRGEGFAYSKNHLVNVIHDWNGSKDTITSGQKAMMIVR